MLKKVMSRVMMLTLLAGVLVALTGCEERLVEGIAAGRQTSASAVDYDFRRIMAVDMFNVSIRPPRGIDGE